MGVSPNRQWRWWFPRATEFANVDPEHANAVADLISNQRRMSLDYRSSAQIYAELSVR